MALQNDCAEAPRARFHGDVAEHVRSPKAFERQVTGFEEGLCLEVHELSLSGWQERKMLRAANKARKAEAPRPSREARILSYEDCE